MRHYLRRMSWKVLITTQAIKRSGQRAQEFLRKAGCEIVFSSKPGPLKAKEVTIALGGMDAVLASLDDYSAAVLSAPAAAQLKIIARWGTGYDRIDLDAATQNGIVVSYTPGLLDAAVADYTFALLLSLARRVCEGQFIMHRKKWEVSLGDDVSGKTLGIIGYGRIGQAVARRASGFNMRVLAHDPNLKARSQQSDVRVVSMNELLSKSDFVSLHAPLTPQNRGLIGPEQLRKMKSSAYLINTARGALLEEAALARALRAGRIAGAALDVFAIEPLPKGSVLHGAPNLLLSPHQASFSRDTSERVGLAAAQSIVDLMNGRRPKNILNLKVFKSPSLRAEIS
jgi:phosphoglycerate dehydrogenase-like enzyme